MGSWLCTHRVHSERHCVTTARGTRIKAVEGRGGRSSPRSRASSRPFLYLRREAIRGPSEGHPRAIRRPSDGHQMAFRWHQMAFDGFQMAFGWLSDGFQRAIRGRSEGHPRPISVLHIIDPALITRACEGRVHERNHGERLAQPHRVCQHGAVVVTPRLLCRLGSLRLHHGLPEELDAVPLVRLELARYEGRDAHLRASRRKQARNQAPSGTQSGTIRHAIGRHQGRNWAPSVTQSGAIRLAHHGQLASRRANACRGGGPEH